MAAPAFDATRVIRLALRSIVVCSLVIVMAMMTIIKPAQASGSVQVIYPPPAITTPLGWGTACFEMNGQGLCGVRTAGEACYYWNTQYGWTFNMTGKAVPLSCNNAWKCPMTREGKTYDFILNLVTPAGCPVPSSGPSYVWNPDTGKCTRSMCPDHASSPPGGCGPPTSCTCDNNYVPDPTGTSCVAAVAACPSNMSGTPCACNTGYVPNPIGAGCVLEQYTISLHGLGGVVMPNTTLAAYAKVITSNGMDKSGASVSLALTVVPELQGQLPLTYTGYLSANTVSIGTTTYAGATGADGRLNFVFTAPTGGGIHTITATCTNCTNSPVTGTITVPGCPVPALTAPPFNDVCATVLENIGSTQAQKDAACGALTPALVAGRNCLSTKLSQLSPAIPLAVTSDIRSVAYQAHLRKVWDSMEDVVRWMRRNPTIQAACAARRAEIAAEKGCDNADGCTSCYAESASQRSHCLKYRPANPTPSDAKHTEGKAFDVSQTRTIDPLQDVLDARTPPQKIPQFLSAPANCNLSWGGAFGDDVHFYVP